MTQESGYEAFGWQDEASFLYGDRLYTPTDIATCHVAPGIAGRAKLLRPARSGQLAKWTRAANPFFAKGCEAQSFALLASFAAPIMQLHGEGIGGTAVVLVGPDYTGRSFIEDAVASVWGKKEGLTINDDDARNIAGLGQLPILYSGIQLRDPKMAAEFIKSYTDSGPPSIIIVSADRSVGDIVSSVDRDYGYRVLEYKTSPLRAKIPSIRSQLSSNSGCAGERFLRRLVQPETIGYLRMAIPKWEMEMWEYTGLDNNYRFHIKTIACVMGAANIVHQLGLIEFSPHRIIRWAMDELKSRVDDKSPKLNPVAIIAEFLREHMRDSIVVKNGWLTRKTKKKYPPLIKPIGDLHVRYEMEEGLVFVDKSLLHAWLKQRGIKPGDIMRGLEKAMVVVHQSIAKTLGGGTEYANRQVVCYSMNFRHPMVNGAWEMFNLDASQQAS